MPGRPHTYKRFKYSGLQKMTNDFSEDNFIGYFQFGKMYRGVHMRYIVTVKIWEEQDPSVYKLLPGDSESRSREEQALNYRLREHHPNLPWMYGFYWESESKLANVFLLDSLDTLHNLIPKDTLTWIQRIKVAIGLASLLQFMHEDSPTHMPYLIRNLDAAHIMLDKDYNPLLIDVSMISGGILTDRKDLVNQYIFGSHGYVDPSVVQYGWSDKCDVYAYGVVLLGMITKKAYTDEERRECVHMVYESPNRDYVSEKFNIGSTDRSSLADQSFEGGSHFYHNDGVSLTNLAKQCVEYNPQHRPSMKQVVRFLQKLCVFRYHRDAIGATHTLSANNNNINGSSYYYKSLRNGKLKNPIFSHVGKNCKTVEVFTYEHLSTFTNGFSDENLIGKFQFGHVYRGKINGRDSVTVKFWGRHEYYPVYAGDNEERLRDELALLQHPKLISHPNVVDLIGYCYEGKHLGIVYDLNPMDSVFNLLFDDNFSWSKRVKVALRFSCLLEFLHSDNPPYVPCMVRNIDAAHIMLDENYNPKLFDFGMISGGIVPDRRKQKSFLHGCYGSMDPNANCQREQWHVERDVFAFGVLLLALFSKKVMIDEDRDVQKTFSYEWAMSEHMKIRDQRDIKLQLVHPSLHTDPTFELNDAHEISDIAFLCTLPNYDDRPPMKQVAKRFLELQVVKSLE